MSKKFKDKKYTLGSPSGVKLIRMEEDDQQN